MPSSDEIAAESKAVAYESAGSEGEAPNEAKGRPDPVRESYATLEAFLRLAPDAIIVTNESGTIVLMNALAEQMFGYSKSELLGQAVEMIKVCFPASNSS